MEQCILLHMNSTYNWLENSWVQVAFLVLGSLLIYYIGGKILALITRHVVSGHLRRYPKKDVEKRQATLVNLVTGIWRILVAFTAIVTIFKVLFPAIDLAPLFTGAGIIGIALAFGSQTLVKDFLTGVFIITENQYRVGDYVKINDADGKVEHIGTRSTVIRDDYGNVHYIPNGSIAHVINKTMGYSKVYFTLSLDISTDLDAAISVINQVGDKIAAKEKWNTKILSAPQFSSIEAFTGKSVDVAITGKTQPSDQWAVTAEMRKQLLRAFEDHDIKLA
ncbi:MAG: mechanosensitive ion channel protein MscS, small conductance mechanosensitive channel [Candidatus Saccharibacteria bacterium]|nr:mechanosensitive ion channel protein MscS, small conductance mechanosensitive channel [Candidatus Saccharibacteria bacterium]